MKKVALPIMIVLVCMAFYEQNKPNPNPYIAIGCIAFFMLGLMRMMSKLPSKNHDEAENFVKSDYKIEDHSKKKEL